MRHNQLTDQLFAVVTSGHDRLHFNVDRRGAIVALTEVVNGKRVSISGAGGDAPAWQRSRELRDGVEHDRLFTPAVMRQHVRGAYSVAPGGDRWWVEWAALDIDAHPANDGPELVARRLAKERAARVLAAVWRALRCSAERQPVIERTPGQGYRLWLPLTRGEASPHEHSWPASKAHGWVERCLREAEIELKPGVLEVYPSGRYLRAPGGHGCVLLQPTRPDDPDALGLVPWPGTIRGAVAWSQARGDQAARHGGGAFEQPEMFTTRRNVNAYLTAFLGQWEAQRRTPADWFSNAAASWDAKWGPLGDRGNEGEIAPTEKNSGLAPVGVASQSQESVDSPRRPQAGGAPLVVASAAGPGGAAPSRGRKGSGSPTPKRNLSPPPADPDCPPAPVSEQWVCGPQFVHKALRLLAEGVTEPSSRHDATLTLAYYWHVTSGLGVEQTLARIEAWCVGHPHRGSSLADKPAALLRECMREARSYLEGRERRGKQRRFSASGKGSAGTLTTADRVVLDAVDARVRGEVAAVMCWLAGRADAHGRVEEAVQIASGLVHRLCGDRRILDEGKRRRATTIAILELERLGVLTLANQYIVGQRGREYACWYRFGSGRLPEVLELPGEVWAKLAAGLTAAAARKAGQIAPSASSVTTRVIAEQVVPEGVVRLLSAGARERPRTLPALPPDVGEAAKAPGQSDAWVARAYKGHEFSSPAELAAANLANVISFPDRPRRRVSAVGSLAQTLGKVIPLRAEPQLDAEVGSYDPGATDPSVSAVLSSQFPVLAMSASSSTSGAEPSAPDTSASSLRAELAVGVDAVEVVDGSAGSERATLATTSSSPVDGEPVALDASTSLLRAELVVEVGADTVEALSSDLADEIARAWQGFRKGRGRDP